MAAEDELALPKVPRASPVDPVDVSWALSTAEAMWARGDHLEGIKWLRKAAEAASDAEDDTRALELAKAASDLSSHLDRSSHAEATGPIRWTPPASRSMPPAPLPLPSRASFPPRVPQSYAPQAPRAPSPPLSGAHSIGKSPSTSSGPETPHGVPSPRNATEATPSMPARARRRSRENLDVETKLAERNEGAPPPASDHLEPDGGAERTRSAAEWDESPPRSLSGDELDQRLRIGDPATSVGRPRSTPAPSPAVRVPAHTVHDSRIQTSQAIRVVVWRDATGVHIAPAGTLVSAITIDAVLVALEPSADLTAWLSERER